MKRGWNNLVWNHDYEQRLPKGKFITLYKAVDEVWSTIQIKATEQYFPVVLFIMLYKVILTFESMAEVLKCDHSNESY